jgi:hypothetical protein
MRDAYDPTKAPMGPPGGKSNRRALMIRHNKKVLARGMKAMKLEEEPKT